MRPWGRDPHGGDDMYGSYGLFIDGAWSGPAEGASTEITDPGNGAVLGTVPAASVEDTERAISVANRAFRSWKATPAWTRADLLHKAADVLAARAAEAARQITLETGKPLAQSGRGWGLAVDQFRWYAE